MAGGQDEARVRVVDRRGVALPDTAEGVHHVTEALEVDDHKMIDVDAGVLLQGLDRAGGTQCGLVSVQISERERLVNLESGRCGHLPVPHLAGWDIDPGVAWDRHDVGPFPAGGDVHDHQGV